jgi:hypothetical protein
MTTKAVKRDRDIDLEAIATWNSEGGAPNSLKRDGNRHGRHDAVDYEGHTQGERAGIQFDYAGCAGPTARRLGRIGCKDIL